KDLQSRKQGGGPVPLVFMAKTPQGASVGQPQPALRTLQGLNCGFFIHTQDHRPSWRVQVKAYDVRSLARKLRIGRHTPAVPPFQFDPMLAQHRPDLIRADIPQSLSQEPSIPASPTGGRGLVQLGQNSPLRGRRVATRRSRAWRIVKSLQTLLAEAPPPPPHPR